MEGRGHPSEPVVELAYSHAPDRRQREWPGKEMYSIGKKGCGSFTEASESERNVEILDRNKWQFQVWRTEWKRRYRSIVVADESFVSLEEDKLLK